MFLPTNSNRSRTMDETTETTHPVADLLRDLQEEFMTLLRQEIALAKSEMGEKARHLNRSAMALGVGAAVAFAGAIVLLLGVGALASWAFAEAGVPAALALWLGPIAVGLISLLVGWAFISKARRQLARENLMPERTVETLRDHKKWAEHKLHRSHA